MPSNDPMTRLQVLLGKLPGIGRRSAERMAQALIRDGENLLPNLIAALREVEDTVRLCSSCGGLTLITQDPCSLCRDPRRDGGLLCVVEDPSDIPLVERSGAYRGRYHSLLGRISPMQGEGIPDGRVEALLRRIEKEGIREVILALNSDMESEATASYLAEVLGKRPVKVTRLAFGIPAGSAIAFSDPITLARALQGRAPLRPDEA